MKMDQTVSGFGDTVADCSMSISEVEVQGLDLGLRGGNRAHFVWENWVVVLYFCALSLGHLKKLQIWKFCKFKQKKVWLDNGGWGTCWEKFDLSKHIHSDFICVWHLRNWKKKEIGIQETKRKWKLISWFFFIHLYFSLKLAIQFFFLAWWIFMRLAWHF